MILEKLDDELLPELVEQLADLRHDLGKYITFEVRFLGPSPSESALRAALRADLLQTRRWGAHTETAEQVWARMRPALLEGDPDLLRIDQALGALSRIDLSGPAEELSQAAALAREVAEACRALLMRGRARCPEPG